LKEFHFTNHSSKMNMKKNIIFLLLIFSICVQSQNDIKKQILGSWKVENIIIESKNKNIIDFANSFKNSVFSFKENRTFIFNPKSNNQLILMFINQLKNAKWIYDEKDKKIKIGTDKDHYSTMGLSIKIENNTAFFYIDETELSFQLIRI
jgi:hypothetical protein